jgi:7-carboxy-7-deazaguanine synthase
MTTDTPSAGAMTEVHAAVGGYPQATDEPEPAGPVWTNHSDNLPVSEVFGPVWQGEGPHTGRLCSFVRLGMCNLSCSWCDTPFTWDSTRYELVFADQSAQQIVDQLHTKVVILSGGEPMMHQNRGAFKDLIAMPHEWHIETNGTLKPTDYTAEHVDHFTVSPKINTDDPERLRIKARPLTAWSELAGAGKAIFKFVVSNNADVDTAAGLADTFHIPADAVWIMPEGVDEQTILRTSRAIADRTGELGFNLTLRQQVLMYGTERAR